MSRRKARIDPALRQEIATRDANTCAYCTKKLRKRTLTIDHVVPESKGGPTERRNLVAACRSCNQRKGSGKARRLANRLRKKGITVARATREVQRRTDRNWQHGFETPPAVYARLALERYALGDDVEVSAPK